MELASNRFMYNREGIIMRLEPTAILSLGLFMCIAEDDLRNINKVELTINNPDGLPLSLCSENILEHATVEAELVLQGIRFRSAIKLESEHWDEFIMTFFADEAPMVSRGDSSYAFTNKSAYNSCEIYGVVQENE